MNRTVHVLLLILLIVIILPMQAVTGRTDGKQRAGGSKRLVVPTVFLGKSDNSGGPMNKDMFDNLVKQGLTSRDSMGNKYMVVGFNFGYAERNVYEDSTGNLQRVMDYSYEYCFGDTLAADISGGLFDRTKPGDTLYFDRISVVELSKKDQSESTPISARSMKFYIVR